MSEQETAVYRTRGLSTQSGDTCLRACGLAGLLYNTHLCTPILSVLDMDELSFRARPPAPAAPAAIVDALVADVSTVGLARFPRREDDRDPACTVAIERALPCCLPTCLTVISTFAAASVAASSLDPPNDPVTPFSSWVNDTFRNIVMAMSRIELNCAPVKGVSRLLPRPCAARVRDARSERARGGGGGGAHP